MIFSKMETTRFSFFNPDSTMAFRNSLYLRRQKTPDLRANEEFLIFSDKNRQEKLWPTGSMNSHDTEPRFHDQIGCNR